MGARGYLTWIINAHFMLFLLNDVRCMGGSGMQGSFSAQINDHCFTRGGLLKLTLYAKELSISGPLLRVKIRVATVKNNNPYLLLQRMKNSKLCG